MVKGTIILESLRENATLTGFRLVVRELGRGRSRLSPQQVAAGLPSIWSAIEFELEDARGGELAQVLAGLLDPIGWYVNFSSETETFVIYPGRVFRYPRGDPHARSEARAFGQVLGIPDHQLDWTE